MVPYVLVATRDPAIPKERHEVFGVCQGRNLVIDQECNATQGVQVPLVSMDRRERPVDCLLLNEARCSFIACK